MQGPRNAGRGHNDPGSQISAVYQQEFPGLRVLLSQELAYADEQDLEQFWGQLADSVVVGV